MIIKTKLYTCHGSRRRTIISLEHADDHLI